MGLAAEGQKPFIVTRLRHSRKARCKHTSMVSKFRVIGGNLR